MVVGVIIQNATKLPSWGRFSFLQNMLNNWLI